MRCGLLGRKLSHSYSPQIHGMLGSYPYGLFEKEPDELEDFLENGNFLGLNVTIPYKKTVIEYCDSLSPCAERLGAVNTLVRRDGKLIGHNTDYYGFGSMVDRCGVPFQGKKALVLGSGGASATAVGVLNDLGAKVTVISRSGPDNYTNLHRHADASLIVNTTPVGMYPEVEGTPIDLDGFPQLECVLDLIYNPANTRLLQAAQARGIPCQNGLWMLVAQAKESAEWFTGNSISDNEICRIYNAIRYQSENITLIGMPGCGKSTVGKLLAEQLGRTFIDTDAMVEAAVGMPIPDIIKQQGEPAFRLLETEAISQACLHHGAVIATGGGCVTKPENYPYLHQNGWIFWLQRDINVLPTDGRPLSQCNSLEQLFQTRKTMYEAFCDRAFDNNEKPEITAEAIVNYIRKEMLI